MARRSPRARPRASKALRFKPVVYLCSACGSPAIYRLDCVGLRSGAVVTQDHWCGQSDCGQTIGQAVAEVL